MSKAVVALVRGPGTASFAALDGLAGLVGEAAGSVLAREGDCGVAGCSSCSSPLEGWYGSLEPSSSIEVELEGGWFTNVGTRLIDALGMLQKLTTRC